MTPIEFATNAPVGHSWEPTSVYAWCRVGPDEPAWLGQMYRCRETGERRFERVPIVEVDENGVPRPA